jgi:hypothetical protein
VSGTATDTQTAVPVRKHYAVWYGPTWDDIYDCPVDSREPGEYTMDPAADHFRFYDRLELEWEIDGETILLRSEPFNHSPYYVPGGSLLTDEERDEAFAGPFKPYAGQRDSYVLFRTRHRALAGQYKAEVEFLPA